MINDVPRAEAYATWCNQTILKPRWPWKTFKKYVGLSRYWPHGFGTKSFRARKQTWDLATPSSMSLCRVWLDGTLQMSESVTNFVGKLKGTSGKCTDVQHLGDLFPYVSHICPSNSAFKSSYYLLIYGPIYQTTTRPEEHMGSLERFATSVEDLQGMYTYR